MEPLRWNEAKPKDHRTKHENQACLVADKGLDVANYSRASGGGRKMFLTSPLIDQAITLKTPTSAALRTFPILLLEARPSRTTGRARRARAGAGLAKVKTSF